MFKNHALKYCKSSSELSGNRITILFNLSNMIRPNKSEYSTPEEERQKDGQYLRD